MKKLLSILLVLCMAVALFTGCAPEEEPDTSPSESVEPSDSPEVSDEPSDESEGPVTGKIGFVIMGLGSEFFQSLAETYERIFTEAGWEATYVSGEFDPTVQIEAVENYIAQAVDVLIVFPMSGEALTSAIDQAREAGIKVICMVNLTENWDAAMESSNEMIAGAVCQMASDWADENFPDAGAGEVKVALVGLTTNSNSSEYWEVLQTVEEYNEKFEVVVSKECANDLPDDGMKMAEDLYVTNPEVNVFVCCSGNNALGINNYYTSLNSPVDDLSNIGVFGINGGAETYDAIIASADDEAVYRGMAVAAGVIPSVEEQLELATGLLDGTFTEPEHRWAEVYSVVADNAAEYKAQNVG